jgi:hypothetical protein
MAHATSRTVVGHTADARRFASTNASATQSAVVLVDFGESNASFRMAPGAVRTATVIGASGYTVEVLAPDLPAGTSYQAQLVQMRADLLDYVGTPYLTGSNLDAFLGELDKVQAALAQLHGSKTSQTCSHEAAKSGHNQVTVTYSQPGGAGPGLWVLACG